MTMKRYQPGDFEYYNATRMKQLIKTIVFFAIPLSLFVAGYVTTGTKKNLLTVVAVLGLLPACKSAVELIMYIKYHGCSAELKELFGQHTEGLTHSYGMVFTTPDTGTYEVPSIVIKNNSICGICLNQKRKTEQLEKHIMQIMKQNGYTKVIVKIFDSKDAYITRMKQMQESKQENPELDAAEMHLLHNISL